MSQMFQEASAFNQEIRTWDVSNVTNTTNMFDGATAFLGNTIWNAQVSPGQTFWTFFTGYTDTDGTVYGANPNPWQKETITNDNLKSLITDYVNNPDNQQFTSSSGYGEPNTWDVSQVTNMSYLFHTPAPNKNFNADINDWDVSNVTTMEGMFYGSNFNKPIYKWNVSKVKNVSYMFYDWTGNQNISTSVQSRNGLEYLAWKFPSDCESTELPFRNAKSFNNGVILTYEGDDTTKPVIKIEEWDNTVGDYVTIKDVVNGDTIEEADIKRAPLNWYIPTSMINIAFNNAYNYNQDMISKPITYTLNGVEGSYEAWNVSHVERIYFYQAHGFNGDIHSWDISNVVTISFYKCYIFNKPLYNWNTSKMTDMSQMFQEASAFNQEIRTWNVSNVTNFNNMFVGATAFIDKYQGELGWSDTLNGVLDFWRLYPSNPNYTG